MTNPFKTNKTYSNLGFWYRTGIGIPLKILVWRFIPIMKIKIESFKGSIRLRWSFEGRRYCLSPGLADNATNKAIAKLKAVDIERDIIYGVFDPTLEKYKNKLQNNSVLKVCELFQNFIDFKRPNVYEQSLLKYQGLLNHLKLKFPDKSIESVGIKEAAAFRDYLITRLAPVTVRERIGLLSACWNWAIKQKLIKENPWQDISDQGARIVKQPPKPLTQEEIKKIIQAFRTDPYYSYYSDYVEFLLGSGCRIGEAIALTWGDINEDCSKIWFGRTYYRGQIKEIKNNKAGYVPLSNNLQSLLLRRRPIDFNPESLVFPAVKGGYMDDKGFRNRAWSKVIKKLGIPYRKPRITRSTLISYWLAEGEDPAVVARYTRTSIKTIYEHYAGSIKTKACLPELGNF